MENQTLINQILEVFKKYQNQPLEYFLIAKIEVFLPKTIQKGVKFRQISSLNTAQIIDTISINQAIKVTLIQKVSENTTFPKSDSSAISQIFNRKFSEDELAIFLQKSGDKNPIHITTNPIVPGLLILETILELHIPTLHYFSIKFTNPLFLHNELVISQYAENEVIGISENGPIFQFKINNN